MEVVVYPPLTTTAQGVEPNVRMGFGVQVTQLTVRWSRRGNDELRATVRGIRAGSGLAPSWKTVPIRPAAHVELVIDGKTVWDGFVRRIDWSVRGEVTGFTAVGYDRDSRESVTLANVPVGQLLARVTVAVAPYLRVEGDPGELGTVSGTYTVADACETLRRYARADGTVIDVRARAGRVLAVVPVATGPLWKPETVLVPPPDAVIEWPEVDDLATKVTVRWNQGTATYTQDAEDTNRIAELGFRRTVVIDVQKVANPSAVAYRLLYERYAPVPALSWEGTSDWELATGARVPSTGIRVGDAVYVAGFGPVMVHEVEHRYPGPVVSVRAGRQTSDDAVLNRLRTVFEVAMLGRDPNAWF
ncbi:MAG: hypothetical protein RMJ05_11345 [Thermomicrobium sp.]|nr:hypothetical protein [Thermomicrobium sp.]MDW8007294.1 hypothetical protein [Thermomicrobium sp.]